MPDSRRSNPIWHGVRRDAAWQFAERAVRAGLGFLVSVVVARTLGPETFGLYSYALSIVALFAFLGQAGLDALLLRELVRDPERAHHTLSEGIAMRLAGALLAGIGSVALALGTASSELAPATPLVAILAFGGLFQSAYVVEAWLQARHRFDVASAAKLAGYVIAAAVRLLALLTPWPLLVLASAALVESVACAWLLWRGASRAVGMRPASLVLPDIKNVRVLAGLAWPMLASAFTVAIYSRIDVFMLGRMVGREAAGLYSAGSMVSEGFSILPAAIMAAVAPRLTSVFATEPARFAQILHTFVRRLSVLGLAIALATTLVAPWLVPTLLGHDYAPAVPILQVAIWATWIVFVSVASDPWYINHDLRRLYLAKTSAAAVLNIVLNLAFIPRWGATGAAWATVVSYAASAVGMGMFWPATRPLFRLQLRAMVGLPPARALHP